MKPMVTGWGTIWGHTMNDPRISNLRQCASSVFWRPVGGEIHREVGASWVLWPGICPISSEKAPQADNKGKDINQFTVGD